MTKIKICGITESEDALVAYRSGADFLGFVFHSNSPRFIKPKQVKGVKTFLEINGIKKWTPIGVFVDEKIENIVRIAKECNLFAIQLHGNESPEFCLELKKNKIFIIKAFRIKDQQSLEGIERYDVDSYLFDTYNPNAMGGTGETFDHNIILPFVKKYRVFLAGGLTPENVGEIIKKVQPYAVDISSGVEKTKGIKDPDKIYRFIKAVKSASLV